MSDLSAKPKKSLGITAIVLGAVSMLLVFAAAAMDGTIHNMSLYALLSLLIAVGILVTGIVGIVVGILAIRMSSGKVLGWIGLALSILGPTIAIVIFLRGMGAFGQMD